MLQFCYSASSLLPLILLQEHQLRRAHGLRRVHEMLLLVLEPGVEMLYLSARTLAPRQEDRDILTKCVCIILILV